MQGWALCRYPQGKKTTCYHFKVINIRVAFSLHRIILWIRSCKTRLQLVSDTYTNRKKDLTKIFSVPVVIELLGSFIYLWLPMASCQKKKET